MLQENSARQRRSIHSAGWALCACLAVFPAWVSAGAVEGEPPVAAPTTRPARDGKNLLVEKGSGVIDAVVHALHSPAPAAAPTSRPAIAVSPAARGELDALRDAYGSLKSLHLEATLSADFDLNGQQSARRGSVRADFLSEDAGAPRFRQETCESAPGADAAPGDAPRTLAHLVGSTGQELYAFDPDLNQYRSTDASTGKFAAGKMPRPYYSLITEQDPSLLLALSRDASAEVLDGLVSIDKAPDETIGDDKCPTLRLVVPGGDTIDLSIDPHTHLIRRSVTDMASSLKSDGQFDVKKAVVTIDYTQTKADAPAPEGAFAWSPPESAHPMTGANSAPLALADDAEGAPALVGKSAPDFKLKGLDGKEVSLADLKGSVVVLDFWATWCGPCRASLPHLNALYEKEKGNGLKAFAIDLKEESDDVAKGAKELKLTLPVLLDSEGTTAEKYGANAIPETVVVGKDGKVKIVTVGAGNEEKIADAVAKAMKE